ncbi:MAG: glycoside hydrolase family 3 C-terminal domain-containing protein, partial [Planctomycetales bacterium]|nr:glycoside hydrolase family 3 C-terminal domain-containing protein [Planctomycetales bacterium]
NRIQETVIAHSRLKIPAFFTTECSHGHMALGGTILPTALAMGCSWDPQLYQEVARSVAEETLLSGEHLALLSCLDVARDPRWGRTEECFGEDPCLTAAMARAATLGTQSGAWEPQHAEKRRIAVVLKHLAGQGDPAGGHNAAAAAIGAREFREIHLPPVKAGCLAGAQSFMAAYNEIDGVPCCANRELLQTLIRDAWGFDGVVMADGFALDNLQEMTGSFAEAGVLGIKAGVDLGLWDNAYRTLEDSIEAGRLSPTTLDRAVARVLRLKFQLGLFDQPYLKENAEALHAARQRTQQLNLQLARESLVLLRNDGDVLPFGKDVRRVAVIGPAADNVYAQLGDYSPPQQPDETTTILAGIRRLLGPSVEVDYALGCSHRGDDGSGIADAVAMADRADAVVVAVGGSSNRYVGTKYLATGAADVASGTREMDCGEGVDLASLELGGRQRELVQALQATGRPLAVVLIQGRPHAIPWIAEHCPAILCAWYPGQQGGLAVAETLFGDANPSGRLAISIPRTVSQLPAYYNHKRRGEATYYDMPGSAQFPFGFGLSYT